MAKRFEVNPQIISNWKREFITRGTENFSTKAPDEEAAKREKALYEKLTNIVCQFLKNLHLFLTEDIA
ncbi:MAG: hypothetical protein VB110_09050 [Bacteroidales bacterium]|nr:hypothetical protein [Bacteroidales bacterium]